MRTGRYPCWGLNLGAHDSGTSTHEDFFFFLECNLFQVVDSRYGVLSCPVREHRRSLYFVCMYFKVAPGYKRQIVCSSEMSTTRQIYLRNE